MFAFDLEHGAIKGGYWKDVSGKAREAIKIDRFLMKKEALLRDHCAISLDRTHCEGCQDAADTPVHASKS